MYAFAVALQIDDEERLTMIDFPQVTKPYSLFMFIYVCDVVVCMCMCKPPGSLAKRELNRM